MSLIRWSPFQSLDSLEDVEKLMDGFSLRGLQGFVPEADIYETKEAVVVKMPLAGVDPQNVEINIEDDMLTVKGRMEHKTEVEDKNYARREIRYGTFMRSLALPGHVDGTHATASSENGLLQIHIPKIKQEKQKTIKIEIKKQ